MNWPIKFQTPSSKQLMLDRSLDLGYCRIKKKETRTYAQLNASRPRTVVTRRKYCSRNCSALETTDPGHKSLLKFKASSSKLVKRQATSFKPRVTSIKLQAGSYKLPDPGTMVHGYRRSIRGTRTKGLYHNKCIVRMS